MKWFGWIIVILLLALIVFMGISGYNEMKEKRDLCSENNGVWRKISYGHEACINESGIYEIVEIKEEWKMIK